MKSSTTFQRFLGKKNLLLNLYFRVVALNSIETNLGKFLQNFLATIQCVFEVPPLLFYCIVLVLFCSSTLS